MLKFSWTGVQKFKRVSDIDNGIYWNEGFGDFNSIKEVKLIISVYRVQEMLRN